MGGSVWIDGFTYVRMGCVGMGWEVQIQWGKKGVVFVCLLID